MSHLIARYFLLLIAIALSIGCSSYQPTKNVWKATKGLWNTYVSPPASVNYEDKGDLPPQAIALSKAMMGVDLQLSKLERAMQNADKPPTQEWLDNHFANFSWLSGFAGIKYDGTILGQQPPDSMKDLDFNYLLYEDKKQNSRALRADIQPSPLGPEIMLATPLYDGVDFLGIVVSYFDMRALMHFSENPQDLVVLAPTALLWPGKYDFAATPLAGVDWNEAVKKSHAGTCTNANGTFIYMVRYLGNLPLIFAAPEKGNFPDGNGNIEQGYAYFPTEREKMTPPPLPERKPQKDTNMFARSEDAEFEQPEVETPAVAEAAPSVEQARAQPDSNEIQPGSRQSVLLRQGKGGGKQIQERDLEGENVPVERVERPRRPARQSPIIVPVPEEEPEMEPLPEPKGPTLPGGRPSPFGPREEKTPEYKRPSPFGPHENTQVEIPADTQNASPAKPVLPEEKPAESEKPKPDSSENDAEPLADGEVPESEPAPATLPGGRPSPFGPRR